MGNKNKRKKKILWIFLILLIISAIFFHINKNSALYNKNYLIQTEFRKSIDPEADISLGMYKNKYVQCSKDGIKLMNIGGAADWDKPYDMRQAELKIKYPYIASADKGGNIIYLFKEEGEIYNLKTKFPILMYDINKRGILTLVEENGDEHFMSIYDNEGNLLAKRTTYAQQDGIPIAIAVNNTGEKIVTSYIDINGAEIINKLTFFDFGSDGGNYNDKIVGSKKFVNALIPQMKFIDENSLVAIGDNVIIGYDVETVPKETFKKELKNKITSVDINPNFGFVVGYGELNVGSESELENKVVLYNKSGKSIGEFEVGKKPDFIKSEGKITVVGYGRSYYGVDRTGKVKWTYETTRDVKDIISLDNGKKYLMVYKNMIEVLKLN